MSVHNAQLWKYESENSVLGYSTVEEALWYLRSLYEWERPEALRDYFIMPDDPDPKPIEGDELFELVVGPW